jgi:hypothetical protein
MVPVEAHLVLNHVPVVGLIFGLVFFVAGLKRSSNAALSAGLRIFVAMGIVVLLVAVSGLLAASLLADAIWLDPDALSVHRQVGVLTLAVVVGLGFFSGILLIVSRTAPVLPAWTMTTVLVLAIAGAGASLWAAYLGGSLRHNELERGHTISTSQRDAADFDVFRPRHLRRPTRGLDARWARPKTPGSASSTRPGLTVSHRACDETCVSGERCPRILLDGPRS